MRSLSRVERPCLPLSNEALRVGPFLTRPRRSERPNYYPRKSIAGLPPPSRHSDTPEELASKARASRYTHIATAWQRRKRATNRPRQKPSWRLAGSASRSTWPSWRCMARARWCSLRLLRCSTSCRYNEPASVQHRHVHLQVDAGLRPRRPKAISKVWRSQARILIAYMSPVHASSGYSRKPTS